MATPRYGFDTNDGKTVLLNLAMAIMAAVIAWFLGDGMEWIEGREWVPAALVPLIYAILAAVQRWLSDTRVDPTLARKE